MAESKKITIFRLDASDSSATVSDDKIEFNSVDQSSSANYKAPDKEGAYIFDIEKTDVEGIGDNQTSEKPDGNVQATGIVEGTYIVTGMIKKLDGNSGNGSNAFLQKLQAWKDGGQEIKDSWEAGVFGIQDLNDSTNTLLPIKFGTGGSAGGPALKFQSYKKKNMYVGNLALITLVFRRSRGVTA